jgi:Phytanoyl-CoA dioxygenase (PhyH)
MIDREFYSRNGYVVARGSDVTRLKGTLCSALTVCTLATLEKEREFHDAFPKLRQQPLGDIVDHIVRHESADEVSGRLYRIFPTAPELLASLADPVILRPVRALGLEIPVAGTAPTVRLDRPHDRQHRTPAHQDWWFSLLSPNCVTVWFPLRPLDREMGFLELVPGSHRQGAIGFRSNVNSNNNPFCPREDWPDSAFISIEVPDDGLLIFSQYLLHRSGFNSSPRTRLSVQLRFNDLASMERAEASYVVHQSDHVIRKQQLLLGTAS